MIVDGAEQILSRTIAPACPRIRTSLLVRRRIPTRRSDLISRGAQDQIAVLLAAGETVIIHPELVSALALFGRRGSSFIQSRIYDR